MLGKLDIGALVAQHRGKQPEGGMIAPDEEGR
jgi:hypothetical protein